MYQNLNRISLNLKRECKLNCVKFSFVVLE